MYTHQVVARQPMEQLGFAALLFDWYRSNCCYSARRWLWRSLWCLVAWSTKRAKTFLRTQLMNMTRVASRLAI